jgi:D-aminopeptidase
MGGSVRARELGIVVGSMPTGALDAITDVAGVRVGHTTVVEGTDIRTGVTAVVPGQLMSRPALAAGLFVGNGYGKLIGATQLVELGEIETPVVLTATLSAFRAADALVTYALGLPGRDEVRSVNPVVAETNDGFLSDIRARPVTAAHVLDALHGAAGGLPAEGAVGAGTGTGALGFKAGIGTASRLAPTSGAAATVGVLVQANVGGVLRVGGVPVPPASVGLPPSDGGPGAGSCVFVVATDARLDARQLGRLARRAVFALGRVGASFAGGSGDYAIAVSTADAGTAPALPERDLEPLFAAVLEAAEEAVLNSVLAARTTVGFRGRTLHALPHDRLLALLGRR